MPNKQFLKLFKHGEELANPNLVLVATKKSSIFEFFPKTYLTLFRFFLYPTFLVLFGTNVDSYQNNKIEKKTPQNING